MIFKPTSPLFYDKLTRATNISDFLASSIKDPDTKTHIFHTSHPDLLVRLISDPVKSYVPIVSMLSTLSRISRIGWSLIAFLRHPSIRPSYSYLSPLDTYAIRWHDPDGKNIRAYWRATFKMLLSERIAFGQVVLIDAILFLIRVWLCWMCAQTYTVQIEDGDWTYFQVPAFALDMFGVHLWRYYGPEP